MRHDLRAMVSSTIVDLPDHRPEVRDACLRMGFFPNMMEHLPTGADPAAESLRLVDESDVYVGIFGRRYGVVPEGSRESLTELEYLRAVERGIPRLAFVMAPEHPASPSDTDGDSMAAERLRSFLKRVQRDIVVNYFASPEDLRTKVVHSLGALAMRSPGGLHHVAPAPAPPEPYIAHPYPLMQTRRLIGRGRELRDLTAWMGDSSSELFSARVLSVVAVGGMGKSALAWTWFRSFAPSAGAPLAGRMWWSFYESDARFESFLVRALAYVGGYAFSHVQSLAPEDRVQKLLDLLDQKPFLLVLDGVERLLLAYSRLDAARLPDDELDGQTGHVATAPALLGLSAVSLTDQHRLRKAVDVRFGAFLQRLAAVQRSRILITSRLAPADLQIDGLTPRPHTAVFPLSGLDDLSALMLWRERGGQASGAVLSILHSFDSHPLVLHVLASTVALDRRARGDFDRWQREHPDFNPSALPLVQSKSHVLYFALNGLSEPAHRTLQVMAAFRMPVTYDTLEALLVGPERACPEVPDLDVALRELEDRGLIGWDRAAGRYDLHPIVRGVAWSRLNATDRQQTYSQLEQYFAAMPTIPDRDCNSLDALTPTLELFHALIGQNRFDDAHRLFFDRLATPMLRWLDAHRLRVQLLESLFPQGTKQLPPLSGRRDQAQAANALSLAYRLSGRPGAAAVLSRQDVSLLHEDPAEGHRELGPGRGTPLGRALRNLAIALSLTGGLWAAEDAARRAVIVDRASTDKWASYWEALDLSSLGSICSLTGRAAEAQLCIRRAAHIMEHHRKPPEQGAFDPALGSPRPLEGRLRGGGAVAGARPAPARKRE